MNRQYINSRIIIQSDETRRNLNVDLQHAGASESDEVEGNVSEAILSDSSSVSTDSAVYHDAIDELHHSDREPNNDSRIVSDFDMDSNEPAENTDGSGATGIAHRSEESDKEVDSENTETDLSDDEPSDNQAPGKSDSEDADSMV